LVQGDHHLIVSYLPEPEKHPLWNEMVKILVAATLDGARVIDTNELVWIAYEGTTLFGVGTTALREGDEEAVILACGGFKHRLWIEQALGVVSAWARDCGAKKLTMRGRKGWARYFRAFGWAVSNADGETVYEKDLTGAQEEVVREH
jgi:hypothetical protein